ncbi:MAG: phage tail tape measure protein [Pseudomonadota bacterium]
MANRESRLTLRLIDGVSGVAPKILGSLNRLTSASKAFTAGGALSTGLKKMGRRARYAAADTGALSTGFAMGGAAAARTVFEFTKVGNAMQAVGNLSDVQRGKLTSYAKELNSQFSFTNTDILKGASELGRAGQSFEQIMGSLRSTLNVSLAGDLDLGKTADIITNVTQAMRLPADTAKSVAESTARVGDALAYAATNANADISDMAVTFKYVAPLAAATGMSMERMAASTMELANNGIKGSNAGTGLRFMLARMLSPTKKMNKALARLNIDLGDFIKGAQTITAEDFTRVMAADGIDAAPFKKQIDKVFSDKSLNKSPAKMTAALTRIISEGLGKDSIIDRATLAEKINETVSALGTQVDFGGFINALRKNPLSEALMGDIFGKMHVAKALALMAGDVESTLAKLERDYRGAADRMSKIRMKGVVGDWYRLKAAVENFTLTLSDTGILSDFTAGIKSFTSSLTALSKANPDLLKTGAYAALALAAIAPLGFALSGMASALSLLVNPLALVAGGIAYLAFQNWGLIKRGFSALKAGISDAIDPATIETLKRWKEGLKAFFAGLLGLEGSAVEFTAMMRRFGRNLANGVDWVVSKLDALGGAVSSFSALTGIDLSWMGKMAAWAAIGAMGLGLIIGPLKFFTKTMLVLSGIKPAWAILKFLGKLAGFGKSAAKIGALAEAVADVGDATGGGKRKRKPRGRISKIMRAAGPLAAVAAGVAGVSYIAGKRGESNNQNRIRAEDNLHAMAIPDNSANLPKGGTMGPSGAQLDKLNAIAARWKEGAVEVKSAMQLMAEARNKDGSFDDFLNPRVLPVIDQVKHGLDAISKTPVTTKLDSAPMVAEGIRAAAELRSKLDINTRPAVDTLFIDAALVKATQLQGALSQVKGGGIAFRPKSVPKISKATPGNTSGLELSQQTIKITPKLDQGPIVTEGAAAATALRSQLSVTAQPIVDASSIDRALSKATQLRGVLSGLGGNVGVSSPSAALKPNTAPLPKKAAGGALRRGMTYEINERGVETVTMGVNGMMAPAGRGGGGTIHATFNVQSTDPQGAAREIERALAGVLDRSSEVAIDGRVG